MALCGAKRQSGNRQTGPFLSGIDEVDNQANPYTDTCMLITLTP